MLFLYWLYGIALVILFPMGAFFEGTEKAFFCCMMALYIVLLIVLIQPYLKYKKALRSGKITK